MGTVYRNIASVGGARKRPGTHEFSAANVSSSSVGRDIDPVIGIDHFRMRAPVFAPHPHAGFSAVTYLFEDGEGEFINRDSLGDRYGRADRPGDRALPRGRHGHPRAGNNRSLSWRTTP